MKLLIIGVTGMLGSALHQVFAPDPRFETWGTLRDAAANLKSSSGDPGLDAVLSEIELRVEVELAKAGQF